MISVIYGAKDGENYLNREINDYGEYESAVKDIIAAVRTDGDRALYEFAEKFDGVSLDSLEVPAQELATAADRVSPEYAAMLRRAAENIRQFHAMQLREGFTLRRADGTVLGQRISPVERAGIYVPGGTASYPSTVLMNAVPAAVAGVKEIIMVTPPDKTGGIKKEVLAAAAIAGVTRVFKIGGAGAIAALAFGTESVPRVDKITGPGNIYVALAKKLVFGAVGVDMIAGPSEILIVADNTADADTVAADMLSQAEHDRLASAVLVTDDRALADAVADSIERQLAELPRREIARAAIDNCGRELEKISNRMTIREGDLEAKREELSTIVESTADEEKTLLARREACTAKLDERTLSAYNRIRESTHNHLAVVTLFPRNEDGTYGDACGGCYHTVTPQRIIDITSGKKLVICEHCGRIIVNPEI